MDEVPLWCMLNRSASARSASSELRDFLKVDMLGVRYKSVNISAKKSAGSPDWCAQIDRDSARDSTWFRMK